MVGRAMTGERATHIDRFYDQIAAVEAKQGGKTKLANLNNRSQLPHRGVYFFFEPGEHRAEQPASQRVTRIGTHGLVAGSKSTLTGRLKTHRGSLSGGGSHRSSIFRLLVGQAILAKAKQESHSWGVKGSVGQAATHLDMTVEQIKTNEAPIELQATDYLGQTTFVVLEINDLPGRDSLRGHVEKNSIALLSNWEKAAIDPASEGWMGRNSNRDRVIKSGLWNQNHVDESYDPNFLYTMQCLIDGAVAQ